MCYIYGNRKIRKMPYLKIAQQLAKFTNQKMEHCTIFDIKKCKILNGRELICKHLFLLQD